jgi:hypothetical protein
MNRAIDAATSEQRAVRRVDDGVDRLLRDVALNNEDVSSHDSFRILRGFPELKRMVN